MTQVLNGTPGSPDQLIHSSKTGQAAAQPLPWELKTSENPRASPLPGYKLPGTSPSSTPLADLADATPSPGTMPPTCLARHSLP